MPITYNRGLLNTRDDLLARSSRARKSSSASSPRFDSDLSEIFPAEDIKSDQASIADWLELWSFDMNELEFGLDESEEMSFNLINNESQTMAI